MRFASLVTHILIVLSLAAMMSACDDGGSNGKAKLRLLNVSADYNSLDVYTTGKDDDADALKLSAVGYGGISDYTSLKAGTYTVKFKRNGVASTLQTLSSTNLAEDSSRTYVAYGSTGHFGVLTIGEDNDAPDSGYTKVQAFNTSEAGSLDVYLTETSVDLDDASPVVSGVASGAASSIATIGRGTFRLRVTGASDTNDLRLDVPAVELPNKGILAIVFTATSGGVLVNAVTLPQEGSPTTYTNSKARVRAAVSISSGTSATLRVGGTSVIGNAPVGVVGSYTQIDGGTKTVVLSVDGAVVPTSDVALNAGGEYTMLIWTNASGTQTTLIGDDNRLPESGKAKIRIVNGLSSLDVPVTLSIDYSPLVEGIVLGQASAYQQVDSSTDYQVDVTNSSTAANLVSRSSVSLQAGNVYTMFTSSTGTTATGTLRKDR